MFGQTTSADSSSGSDRTPSQPAPNPFSFVSAARTYTQPSASLFGITGSAPQLNAFSFTATQTAPMLTSNSPFDQTPAMFGQNTSSFGGLMTFPSAAPTLDATANPFGAATQTPFFGGALFGTPNTQPSTGFFGGPQLVTTNTISATETPLFSTPASAVGFGMQSFPVGAPLFGVSTMQPTVAHQPTMSPPTSPQLLIFAAPPVDTDEHEKALYFEGLRTRRDDSYAPQDMMPHAIIITTQTQTGPSDNSLWHIIYDSHRYSLTLEDVTVTVRLPPLSHDSSAMDVARQEIRLSFAQTDDTTTAAAESQRAMNESLARYSSLVGTEWDMSGRVCGTFSTRLCSPRTSDVRLRFTAVISESAGTMDLVIYANALCGQYTMQPKAFEDWFVEQRMFGYMNQPPVGGMMSYQAYKSELRLKSEAELALLRVRHEEYVSNTTSQGLLQRRQFIESLTDKSPGVRCAGIYIREDTVELTAKHELRNGTTNSTDCSYS